MSNGWPRNQSTGTGGGLSTGPGGGMSTGPGGGALGYGSYLRIPESLGPKLSLVHSGSIIGYCVTSSLLVA